VRQLLLAALGAAGSLLMGLPGLAQLSNTTSTFSGQVAATCSFTLPENIEMIYDGTSNLLYSEQSFELNTNLDTYKVSFSRIVVNKEPQPLGQEIDTKAMLRYVSNGRNVFWFYTNKTLGGYAYSAHSSRNQLNLWMEVATNQKVGNYYDIPPGEYSYSITITCLL